MSLKNYLIYNEFKIKAFLVIPKDNYTAVLQFLNNLACIIPILSNYLCFYFIIRDSYKKPNKLDDNLVSKDDLLNFSTIDQKNNEIKQYLK